METTGTLYRPVLDNRCLICLEELPDKEIAYWKKRLQNQDEWDKETSIMKVSCVKCARKRGKTIPKELEEMLK